MRVRHAGEGRLDLYRHDVHARAVANCPDEDTCAADQGKTGTRSQEIDEQDRVCLYVSDIN